MKKSVLTDTVKVMDSQRKLADPPKLKKSVPLIRGNGQMYTKHLPRGFWQVMCFIFGWGKWKSKPSDRR
jgi:hypothetical protein